MGIIVLMISLGAKIINSLTGNQSLGQINSTVADILNDARTQAMARNTYFWVGFSNVAPDGSAKLTVAVVESVTGQASDLTANPPALKVVMPTRSFVGVSTATKTAPLPDLAGMATPEPAVTPPTTVELWQGADGTNATPMSFSVRSQTFSYVIQFDPQGIATCQQGVLTQWTNVKLHQNLGSQKNLAAVQVSGTTGAVTRFWP